MRKGILIDVKNETIEFVLIEKGIQPIYDVVECGTFEVVNINDSNDIYVDEEGLLYLTNETKFFQFGEGRQPIAGNGLILGYNQINGESIDTNITIEEVKDKVKFLTLNQVRELV